MSGDCETNQQSQPFDRQVPDIVVTPEPSEEELAAIVAAVTVISRIQPAGDRSDTASSQGRSRWADAGRREAMRGLARDVERR